MYRATCYFSFTAISAYFLLQVAAELDRSDTARALLEVGAPAGVKDDSGLSALVLMIAKMPGVVSTSYT